MASDSEPTIDNAKLFEELDAYSWGTDKEFQSGLAAILGPAPSLQQSNELTIRAKCFYYTRKKNVPVDFNAYKTHVESTAPTPLSSSSSKGDTSPSMSIPPLAPNAEVLPSLSSSSSTSPEPPYPIPFASIVALITSGAPIPGIKEIPPTVLTSQATKPGASKRRKPWEKEDVVSEDGRNIEGTFGDRRDEDIVQDFGEGKVEVS